MEVRRGEGSADEDEEAADSRLIHRRLILMLAWRRRLVVAGRASRRHPGSSPGKKGNKKREFFEADRIRRQYFGPGGRPPTYDDTDFQRRFRMPRSHFLRIYDDIKDEPLLVQRPNATSRMQARPSQKLVAALRVLSYGDAEDWNGESV